MKKGLILLGLVAIVIAVVWTPPINPIRVITHEVYIDSVADKNKLVTKQWARDSAGGTGIDQLARDSAARAESIALHALDVARDSNSAGWDSVTANTGFGLLMSWSGDIGTVYFDTTDTNLQNWVFQSSGAGDTLNVTDGFGIASTYNDTTLTLTTNVDTTDTNYVNWVEATGGGGTATMFSVLDFGASGLDDTTSGAIAQGESALVVTDPSTFAVGQGVWVESAMVGRWGMVQTVTRIVGDTLFLSDTAEATVAGAMVQHDDTRAIQAGIDSMVTQGGGVLYFPVIGCDGIYNVNDTFSTWNGLLHLTNRVGGATTIVPLVFRGENPPMNPWTNYALRSPMIRSWNVVDGTGNHPAVISGGLWGTAADSGQGDNFTEVVFENMGFITRSNSNLSGLNLNNCLYADIRNCQFRAADTAGLTPQTSPITYGVIMPRRFCGPNLGISNVAITGFAVGVQAAEHIVFDRVFVRYAGIAGVEFVAGHRPNWGLITVESSPCALWFTDGQTDLDLHLNYEINESGSWHTHANQTILDSNNYARGRVSYNARNANDGGWNSDIAMTGGDSLTLFNVRQHEYDQWKAKTATAANMSIDTLSVADATIIHSVLEFTNTHPDTVRPANNTTGAGAAFVIHGGNTTAGPVTAAFTPVGTGASGWTGVSGVCVGGIYAANASGAYRSTDGGNTFTLAGAGGTLLGFMVGDTTGAVHANYASVEWYKSTDNGATWPIDGWSVGNYGYGVAFDTSDNTYYYALTDSIRKSTDIGVTWTLVAASPFTAHVGGLAVAPSGDLWISGNVDAGVYGVARSTDKGATWSVCSGLPSASQGSWGAIAVPTPNSYVYVHNAARTDSIWRSTNNGATWTTLATPIAATMLTADVDGNLYICGSDIYRYQNPTPVPNYAGGDLVLQAGFGTGSSAVSGIVLKVGDPGVSGITPQDTMTVMMVKSDKVRLLVPDSGSVATRDTFKGLATDAKLLQGKDTTALWNAKTLQGKDTTAMFVFRGSAPWKADSVSFATADSAIIYIWWAGHRYKMEVVP
jgi:hypothetical protein